MTSTTLPEVFILESLDLKDEAHARFEGRILSDILALSGKKCRYFYFRTKRELPALLDEFSSSNYRYLHLSCHGDKNQRTLHTTLDQIPFSELETILCPVIDKRRLFLSACTMANKNLANVLMPNSTCFSVLGPHDEIYFHTAPILWASLYHLMFTEDKSTMKHAVLQDKAQSVADMFRVELNYIRRDSAADNGYSIQKLKPARRPKKQL